MQNAFLRPALIVFFTAACFLAISPVLSAGGKKEKNMISLNMLANAGQEKAVSVEASFLPSQALSYSFELYASVGYDADYRIEDESVVAFVERKEVYKNPKRLRQGMTGADDAEGTFVFKTLKSGKTTVTIRHLFRGEVEKEVTIHITVE